MTNNTHDGVFNYPATLHRLGGDVELFTDLVRFFLEDVDGLVTRFHEAVELNDAAKIEAAAHAIKGLCSNFDAERAVRVAAAAEEAAQEQRLTADDVNVAELDTAVDQLKAALMQYLVTRDGH